MVNFCFVDGSERTPTGLDTHLLHYRHLLSLIPNYRVIYVSADDRTFAKAQKTFARICGDKSEIDEVIDPDLHRVVEHFRMHTCWENRQMSGFDKRQLDQLRDELQEFGGPYFDALFLRWKDQGDATVLTSAAISPQPSGTFATYHIEHDYSFLGAIEKAVSA